MLNKKIPSFRINVNIGILNFLGKAEQKKKTQSNNQRFLFNT